MQVLYLGRAPRTKETLPDFREKCRVTRHSRVFRGLTGSQQTPGIWGVTAWYQSLCIRMPRELGFGYPSPRMKISVSTDISVLGFYGYIGYIGDISVDIFT